jgi:phosphoglycolate phosphatase
MKYSAVLFDLDGTLLDTIDDLADAANTVLEKHGWPTHDIADYKYFVGDGVVNLVRRAMPVEESADAMKLADCVREMREQYDECWDNKTKPYVGIPELLTTLTENNIALTVMSNKPHDFTIKCVEKFLGDFQFAVVQGVNEDVPPKPDLTGPALIAETLHLPPQAFAYLGDTNTDMQTAVKAGMLAVGANWGFRPAEELLDAGAEVVIDEPHELLEVLRSI